MTANILEPEAIARFSDQARQAVYDVIALRRDVRHFDPDRAVDEATLLRVLGAAHAAPSVGLSQPWGFVVVRNTTTRERVRESFLRCRAAEAARFPVARREKYLSYRLEGILEAPLNLCVAVDLRSRGEAILGTTVQPESLRASACCAVQNLWLAARAEGLGVGWVSIVEPAVLRTELALPPGVEPIAYVCVGHPRAFRAAPMLEEVGWSHRRPLAEVTHDERWRDPEPVAAAMPPSVSSGSGGRAIDSKGENVGVLPARRRIEPLNVAARDAALAHQAALTKPKESLGRLEELAVWYAAARGVFPVAPPARPALALFLADHGVVEEGVSAYGSQVTAGMACNVMAGGAAVSVLARKNEVTLVAVDVGIAGDLSAAPREPRVPLVSAKVRAGTANLRIAPAMSREEAEAAMAVGGGVADDLEAGGATLVGVGEIGIGNTTAGAALVAVFAGADPEVACGRGTGIDEVTLARKIQVVKDALALHRPSPADPVGALAAVGGLELAAMTGFMLRAAAHRIPIVLDGFLAGAAALVARTIDPVVLPYLVASHASAERGARVALASLGLEPLLSLGMRLGEGTGALLGIELVRSAVELQAGMATFATAGIVR
jgi:nicotinate-nucleotide--dimethylbenzimidazole phosphoribosyltransferase